eukprot:jgi/Picsp_1/74/NSC_00074-R1_pry- scp-like extracellular
MSALKLINIIIFLCGVRVFGVPDGLLQDSRSEIQAILDQHNRYRSIHGVPKLSWSSSLAKSAQQWASACNYMHKPGKFDDASDNLAAFAGYDPKVVYNVSSTNWYNEVKLYDFRKPERSKIDEIGHFTQMVWKSTKKLGCGRAACSKNNPFGQNGQWLYVVCQYDPRGNILSADGNDRYRYFKENVLPPNGSKDDISPMPSYSCEKTVKIKVKFHVKKISCADDVHSGAIKAAERLLGSRLRVCKAKGSCSPRSNDRVYIVARLYVPRSQHKNAMSKLKSSLKNGSYFSQLSASIDTDSSLKGGKWKVCVSSKTC